jgi:hypothetical protein
MLQTEVLRPWIRMSFDTFRIGLQVQSSVMSLFDHGRALVTPLSHAPAAPTPLASALAGTPYAPEVIQAVTDEIALELHAMKPTAARVKARPSSQRAANGAAHKAVKSAAKKRSARKAHARWKS